MHLHNSHGRNMHWMSEKQEWRQYVWVQFCVLAINQFDYIEKSFYWSPEYGSLLLFIDCPKMEV